MVRARKDTISIAVAVTMVAVGCLCDTASAVVQQPVDAAEISSIELLPGMTSETFTLRVRCSQAREFSAFWVGRRTFVLDIRGAYTPFRGNAVRQWETSPVEAVRASQFMESPFTIARVEVDVLASMGAVARWVDSDLDIMFVPPGPSVVVAGQWPLPAGTTGARQQAAADIVGAEQPAQPPQPGQPATTPTEQPTQRPVWRPGGRENPFDPIIKPPVGVDMANTITRPLPNAEQLTLSGIVYDENRPNECIALLRDGQGKTYRLKKGDRVLFGFVSEITPKEIVFRLDIYGRRKEVRLTLDYPLER